MKETIYVIFATFIALILHTDAKSRWFSDPGKTSKSSCHQKNEYYLVDPGGFGNSAQTHCSYLRCVNAYYKKARCPRGTSIDRRFQKKGQLGVAQSIMPCTRHAGACGNPGDDPLGTISRTMFNVCGMDLIWVVDMSCSIDHEDKMRVIKFIKRVIESFRIDSLHVKTGGVSYGHAVHNIQTLNQGRNRPITLRNFDKMITDDGKCRTVTNEAMRSVRDIYFNEKFGDRPQFKNVLLVLTDGKTYWGKKEDNEALSNETIQLAEEIRTKKHAETIVVGLPARRSGKLTGFEEWLGIAGSEKNIYIMESFEELASMVKNLALKSCVYGNGV